MKNQLETLNDEIRSKMKQCISKMFDNSLSDNEKKENFENYALWCKCCVTLEYLINFANDKGYRE